MLLGTIRSHKLDIVMILNKIWKFGRVLGVFFPFETVFDEMLKTLV